MNNTQKLWKLTKVKDVYHLFCNCLSEKLRDKWIKVLDEAEEPDLTDNYEADNMLGVDAFYGHQRTLVKNYLKMI